MAFGQIRPGPHVSFPDPDLKHVRNISDLNTRSIRYPFLQGHGEDRGGEPPICLTVVSVPRKLLILCRRRLHHLQEMIERLLRAHGGRGEGGDVSG